MIVQNLVSFYVILERMQGKENDCGIQLCIHVSCP